MEKIELDLLYICFLGSSCKINTAEAVVSNFTSFLQLLQKQMGFATKDMVRAKYRLIRIINRYSA